MCVCVCVCVCVYTQIYDHCLHFHIASLKFYYAGSLFVYKKGLKLKSIYVVSFSQHKH